MTINHVLIRQVAGIARPLQFAIAACLMSSMGFANEPASAPAQVKALPAGLPAYDAQKPLPQLGLVERRLDNGITVWVLPRKGGLPKVDYALAIRGGLASDPKQLPGMSSLLAGLLQEGTTTRKSVDIAEQLEHLGASISASASSDGLFVRASGLSSSSKELATLLADVVRNPSFPENEVTLAKTNALQGLKASEAQPGFQANRAMARALYGDHPYGNTMPTESGINGVDVKQLKAAHALRFQPQNALLVIAGPIDESAAMSLAKEAFGEWKSTDAKLAGIKGPTHKVAAQHVLVPRTGSVQSTLRIGRPAFAADDARAIPAALASTILGGGFDSRLMSNLREEKGYTYGAYSSFDLREHGGSFLARADVRNEVTGAAIGEFNKEFEKLRTTPVSADELERAKRYTAGTYLFQNQLQGAVASALAGNWLLGRPADYLSTYVAKTNEVTAAQVQTVAREFFDPKKQNIVVVGDAAVGDQLKPFGNFKSN